MKTTVKWYTDNEWWWRKIKSEEFKNITRRHTVRSSGKPAAIKWGSGEIGGPRHDYRESLLLGLVKGKLQKGNVVLDAGCGSGSLLLSCQIWLFCLRDRTVERVC